jgi:hypothetical protein
MLHQLINGSYTHIKEWSSFLIHLIRINTQTGPIQGKTIGNRDQDFLKYAQSEIFKKIINIMFQGISLK